ncbi:MAG: hypothetical protein IJB15_08720, partial [Clostridia bacterium]|nr:hypothetical protein [Clostridia bacterium]
MSYNEGMSPADYAAVSGNNNRNGLFGDDLLGLIVLFALFGGGWGGGFGGFGGGGGGLVSAWNGVETRTAIHDGFTFNNIERGIQAIQQGICDSTYALNNALMTGFHGVDNAICNLGYNVQSGFNSIGHQISDCCCTTQRAIDNV